LRRNTRQNKIKSRSRAPRRRVALASSFRIGKLLPAARAATRLS